MQINRVWFFVVVLLAAVAALYGQFLWNPIVFDDNQYFMLGSDTLDRLTQFNPLQLRWLPYASIAWTVNILGRDLIWLRLETVLLHAAVGVAMFAWLVQLYRQMSGMVQDSSKDGRVMGWAFFAALLFVLHPVAVYGAGYLIQRTIVMATLFSLLALLAYMKGTEKNSRSWLWGSVALYGLAVLSKEHAIMLPMVMLALTLLLSKEAWLTIKKLWQIYVVCFLIALFALSQKMGVLGVAYEIYAPEMLEKTEGGGNNYLLSILTQCVLFFKYLGLWLLPNPAWMSVDMREPFAVGLLSPYWFGMLGYLVYGGVAVRLLFKRAGYGLLGFAMLFPWLLFWTEFSTIRIQESFVLYRSYLWMPGIFVVLPLLMMRVKPRVAIIAGVPIVLLLAMFAVNRLVTFSHPLLLWDDAEKLVHDKQDLPGVDRIYGNRAKYFDDVKRYPDAIADYQTALKLRPNFSYYYHSMSITYLNMGEYTKAVEGFSKAVELEPQHMRAYYGRGLANDQLGNRATALVDFEKSCELGWQSGCAKAQSLKGGG